MILLYVFYIQNIINYFLYVTTVIVRIFSLVLVLEALFKNNPIKKNLNNRTIYLYFFVFFYQVCFLLYMNGLIIF